MTTITKSPATLVKHVARASLLVAAAIALETMTASRAEAVYPADMITSTPVSPFAATTVRRPPSGVVVYGTVPNLYARVVPTNGYAFRAPGNDSRYRGAYRLSPAYGGEWDSRGLNGLAGLANTMARLHGAPPPLPYTFGVAHTSSTITVTPHHNHNGRCQICGRVR